MNTQHLTTLTAALLGAIFTHGCSPSLRQPITDLRVESIYLAKYVRPENLKAYEPIDGSVSLGQKVYLVCRFSNNGPEIRGRWKIAFQVDDQEVYTTELGDIPAGLTQDPAGYWIAATPGPHKYSCKLDPENAIAESNKDNNSMTISFDVR